MRNMDRHDCGPEGYRAGELPTVVVTAAVLQLRPAADASVSAMHLRVGETGNGHYDILEQL
jgi:hypothetical protein